MSLKKKKSDDKPERGEDIYIPYNQQQIVCNWHKLSI